MVYMKQIIIAYKKFTCQQKYSSQFNITGTSEALELDSRAELLVDTTHFKVVIRQPVPFGTKNIFTTTKQPLTCCTGWDTSVELHKHF